jgi:hypothetical protein
MDTAASDRLSKYGRYQWVRKELKMGEIIMNDAEEWRFDSEERETRQRDPSEIDVISIPHSAAVVAEKVEEVEGSVIEAHERLIEQAEAEVEEEEG